MSSILSRLSDEQRAAAETRAAIVRVIAGPGSGKTSTLAGRATALLLDQNVSPKCLVCVSFTRKASTELRERVELSLASSEGQRVAEIACRQITFGTMHSFCLGIIRAFSSVVGLPENLIVLDEEDAADIRKSLAKRFPSLTGESLDLVYAKHKVSIGAADYNDLLLHALAILQHPIALTWARARYRYLIYDEFQDIGPAEYEVIRQIAPRGITICGDPDQNIYSWRGTALRFLLGFDQEHKDCETHYLSRNYRSCSEIVDAASNLISHNRERLEKPSIATWSGGSVRAVGFASPSELTGLFLPGDLWRNWAILARTNRSIEEAEAALRAADVPVTVLSDNKTFWAKEPVRLTLAALRFCESQVYDWALEYMLRSNLFGEVTEVEIAEARLQQVQNRGSLWSAWCAGEGAGERVGVSILRRLVADYEAALSIQPVVIAAGAVIDLLQLRAFYEDAGRTSRAALLTQLLTRMAGWGADAEPGKGGTRDYLAWAAMRSAQDRHKATDETVTLSTIHGAKGLEWENVIIWDADGKHMPLQRKSVDQEEERRLAYVALTRAKRYAVLGYRVGEQPTSYAKEIQRAAQACELVVDEESLREGGE